MDNMFYGCKSLKKLNLKNFNINNKTKINNIFHDCFSLKELICSNELINEQYKSLKKKL